MKRYSQAKALVFLTDDSASQKCRKFHRPPKVMGFVAQLEQLMEALLLEEMESSEEVNKDLSSSPAEPH